MSKQNVTLEEIDSIDYGAIVASLSGQELTEEQKEQVKKWHDLYDREHERKAQAGELYVQ